MPSSVGRLSASASFSEGAGWLMGGRWDWLSALLLRPKSVGVSGRLPNPSSAWAAAHGDSLLGTRTFNCFTLLVGGEVTGQVVGSWLVPGQVVGSRLAQLCLDT